MFSEIAKTLRNDESPVENVSRTTDPNDTGIDKAETNPDVDLDQVFDILQNERRRYVLRYLNDNDDPLSLSDLAEQLAAWECDKDVRDISAQERKRVYVGLYQCHLPKMASASAISYNKPRGMIEKGEKLDLYNYYLPSENTTEDQPSVTSKPMRLVASLLW